MRTVIDEIATVGNAYTVMCGETGRPVFFMRSVYSSSFGVTALSVRVGTARRPPLVARRETVRRRAIFLGLNSW